MATQRKSGASRSKTKKAVRKTAAKVRPKRASATAASGKAAAKARPRRVVAQPPKPAAAKGATVRGGVKAAVVKGAVAKGKVQRLVPAAAGARRLVPAAAGSRRLGMKVAPGKPPAPVRPLGVLPPEAIARATQRPPTPVVRHPERPAARPAREPHPDQADQGVSEQDYQDFEQRLLVERQKILKEMGHLESTVLKVNQRESAGDLSGYSFHMADVGTDAMEREKAFLFASTEGRLLMEIDEALRRVYRSEYGACETCGKPIGRARLEAMPYARLCLACKEKEERGSRGVS